MHRMKRSPGLQKFSREHHTALKLARDFRQAVDANDQRLLEAACAAARHCYEEELAPHFREEETFLLPHLQAAGCEAVVARTLVEHRAMKRAVRDLEIADADALRRFADLLADHVRFEERELFETAQRVLDAETLARVAQRCEELAPGQVA